MINLSSYPQKTGTFPSVEAIPVSGNGLKDGTPITAAMINDIWGWMQALMDTAQQTPNGNNETYDASQLEACLKLSYGYPGELVMFCGNLTNLASAKSSGLRLLALDGTTYLIADYSWMSAATYCGDSNNPTAEGFYKTSDSGGTTRSTSGTYIVLPDYRGVFIRGSDERAGGTSHEPDTRILHSLQHDKIKKHGHYVHSALNSFARYDASEFQPGAAPGLVYSATKYTDTLYSYDEKIVGSSQLINQETRPINRNVTMCVRY